MKKFMCLVLSLITVVTLISCSKKDDSDIPTGMVIGKHGKIAKAIRNVMKAAANSNGQKVNVEIK